MNAEQLLKAMRAQREIAVPMGGPSNAPRSMTLLRPTELDIQRKLIKLLPPGDDGKPKAELMLDPDTVHEYVVNWAGYTEADLLGPAGGSSAAPFSPELVQEWLANNPSDCTALVDALLGAVVDHINRKAEAEKN